MEFAIVVLAFLGLGFLLDRIFDTKPLFMIVLVVLSLVGQFASMWYGYDARMRHLEDERRANSTSATRARHERGTHAPPPTAGRERMYAPAVDRPGTAAPSEATES